MLISKAAAFAARAHKEQFRKDGITPYFYHCALVANLVERYCFEQQPSAKDAMVAAAYLHDVVEDTHITAEEIQKQFGTVVCAYVVGLTNVYTKEAYPNLNRKTRKDAECLRLKNLCVQIHRIKLADRLANVIDLGSLEKGFQRKFISETLDLLDSIGTSHPALAEEIRSRISAKI